MNISYSAHAERRMEEMGVSHDLVDTVLAWPELTLPNPPPHPAGRIHVGLGICVPVTHEGTVLTVLWHLADGRGPNGEPTWVVAA